MRRDRIQVVTAADTTFIRPLAAFLQSVAISNESLPMTISVLTNSIGESDRRCLSSICAVHWLECDDGLLDGVQVPPYMQLSSYWRLLLPDLLPANTDRVLYLDADVIVRETLAPLWETELDGAAIGAVRDPLIPWFGAPLGPPWDELGVPASCPYFNAGVLLIDIAAWRRDRISERAIELLRGRELPHGDQCALNTVVAGRWKRLPARWNLQAGHLLKKKSMGWIVEPAEELAEAISEPAVIHFNSSEYGRPWEPECTHPSTDQWRSALGSTPWAGQPAGQAGPRREFRRRIRRAASVLLRG